MSQVKILEDKPVIRALFSAMCKKAPFDVVEAFKLLPGGEATTAEVVVTVNGVEVDLMGEVADFVNMVHTNLDEIVKDKAEELWSDLATPMTDAGFEIVEIGEQIKRLSWKVRQVLDGLEK